MSEPRTRKTYSLPRDLAAGVRNAARRRGEPESAIVREALQRYFEASRGPDLPAFVGMASGRARDPDRPIREQIADMRIREHGGSSGTPVSGSQP